MKSHFSWDFVLAPFQLKNIAVVNSSAKNSNPLPPRTGGAVGGWWGVMALSAFLFLKLLSCNASSWVNFKLCLHMTFACMSTCDAHYDTVMVSMIPSGVYTWHFAFQKMGWEPILCICVCVSISTMLNFHAHGHAHRHANVMCKQSFT